MTDLTPEQEAKCREAAKEIYRLDIFCQAALIKGAAWSAAQAGREELIKQKDQAYWERNRLVAILARLYPSGRAVTDIPGWDAAWHNCIYIDLPTGQASWHIHDDEMMQFASLPEYTKPWDGHSIEEKYRRLLLLLLKLPTPPTQPSSGGAE